MVFWISSTVISVVILIMSGMKLIRSNSQPKWPLAVVFSLAILASLGSVVLATVTSVNVRQSLQANNNEKVRPDDSFDSLVANLQKDLKKNPGRIEGWSLLGRSFVALGRLDDAISAFRQAVERSDPPAAEQIGELAETIVAAAGGRVEQEAEQLFAQVLTINPGDPRPLLFGGSTCYPRQSSRGTHCIHSNAKFRSKRCSLAHNGFGSP